MSENSAYIVRTIFQNIDPSGLIVDETHGIRVYDEFQNAYSDLVNDKQSLTKLTVEEIFELANEIGPSIIRSALSEGGSIWIDGKVYLNAKK